MKKTFISAAIASALSVASFAALADGPQFYGRIDVAATTTEASSTLQGSTSGVEKGHAGTYFENNFSHIGVKGTQNIAAGYDIVYQMEFGVDNMSDNGKTFGPRNTFLGLKTNAGTVLVGRNDNVFKQAEGNVDAFGNTNADIDRLVAGQSRNADGVWYYSPKIANLVTVNATYLMKDNQIGDKAQNEQQYAVSATLGDKKLKAQNYYVAAGYIKGISDIEGYRGVAQVKLGDLTLGALAQNSKSLVNDNQKGDTYFVNAKYNLNGVNLKLQYGYDESGLGSYFKNITSNTTGYDAVKVSDVKINNITAGADYRLSKSTLVYGQYAHYEGDYKLAGAKQDLKQDGVFSVGVRYDF